MESITQTVDNFGFTETEIKWLERLAWEDAVALEKFHAGVGPEITESPSADILVRFRAMHAEQQVIEPTE